LRSARFIAATIPCPANWESICRRPGFFSVLCLGKTSVVPNMPQNRLGLHTLRENLRFSEILIALCQGTTSKVAQKSVRMPILDRFVKGHDFSRAASSAI
jgi:hypothetical protein